MLWRGLALVGCIERPEHRNGFQNGIVVLMRLKGQRLQKLRRTLTNIAVMVIEEVKITPMGKPPPLAVRLEKALPFQR